MFIGFAGQKAYGKDYLADYLLTKLENYVKIPFASNVKKIYKDCFGVDDEFIEKWKRREEIPEGFELPVRKSLQFIGDGFRNIQQDVWVKKVLESGQKNILISDVRYLREEKNIHDAGGIVILIHSQGYENDDECRSESEILGQIKRFYDAGYKEGEACSENVNFFIRNTGKDFYSKVDEILLPYLMKRINNA